MSYSRRMVGWKVSRWRQAALQFGEQWVARGVGPWTCPSSRRGRGGPSRAGACGRRGFPFARAGATPRSSAPRPLERARDSVPPPAEGHARKASRRSAAHQPAIAWRAGSRRRLGQAKPATISRSSCRAATGRGRSRRSPQIEHRQPLGEQLAVDHALAEPGHDAEADARELVSASPTRRMLRASICWMRLRSTTQSTLAPSALARWLRLSQISSA